MIPLFQSILPKTTPQGGNLPSWLLFISVVSIFNSIQTYQSKDLQLTKKVYENEANKADHKIPQVTGLSARTFGTWTLITSIVRFYGAYNIQNKQVYELVQFSFLVAGLHFLSEWLVYKTCKLGKGIAGPLVVSSVSIAWMFSQKSFYLSN
ncbi:Erg28 like protein-domain-containing protein [Scheffersomyces amazonensis]|uniref:Erg28 like protein-domain-containing protein n=1 Tax=Scheffersomyces amazonensis TaxID=1078765 RepID=UPI00315CB00A